MDRVDPDSWNEEDIEAIVRRELANVSVLPADELVNDCDDGPITDIGKAQVDNEIIEAETINALIVASETAVLVDSVVVRKDAWSEILRFHNERQREDNITRKLESSLLTDDEKVMASSTAEFNDAAEDSEEAAIWAIDTNLPELLLHSNSDTRIAEISEIEREQEESKEFLRRLQSPVNRLSVLDPHLMRLRESIYQEDAEQIKIAHTIRTQRGAQAQLRYKLDRLKNIITTKKAEIRTCRDCYLDACQQIKSIEKDLLSTVNIRMSVERPRTMALWRAAEVEMNRLLSTVIPTYQQHLTTVQNQLSGLTGRYQLALEEFEDAIAKLESEQADLLAFTRSVETEEKRGDCLQKAHRLMVQELEVMRMEAAIKLQTRWRSRQASHRYSTILSASRLIQRIWRRYRKWKIARLRQKEDRLRSAATKIQAVFRSFRIRKKYLAVCAQFARSKSPSLVDCDATKDKHAVAEDCEQLEEIDIDDFLAGKETEEFDMKWDHYLNETDALPLEPLLPHSGNRRLHNSEVNIHQPIAAREQRLLSLQETSKIESLKNEWGLNSWEAAQRMYDNKKRHSKLQNKQARRQALKDPLERLKQFKKLDSANVKGGPFTNIYSSSDNVMSYYGDGRTTTTSRGGRWRTDSASSSRYSGSFLPDLPVDTKILSGNNRAGLAAKANITKLDPKESSLPLISPNTFKTTW